MDDNPALPIKILHQQRWVHTKRKILTHFFCEDTPTHAEVTKYKEIDEPIPLLVKTHQADFGGRPFDFHKAHKTILLFLQDLLLIEQKVLQGTDFLAGFGKTSQELPCVKILARKIL